MMPSSDLASHLTPPRRSGHTEQAWCSRRRKAPEHNREWGRVDPIAAPKASAAPTVSGERLDPLLGRQVREVRALLRTASQETGLQFATPAPSV
jgi:hypothetical protein